jgi:septal ring factor EnvC (AmiA/AmiB activator)
MKIMDDRKKKIGELERAKKDSQAALNSLLAELGKALLTRPGIDNANADDFPDIGEYRRLQKEIADSEDSIKIVETQITRQRVLEEGIEAKGLLDSAHLKELTGFYIKMGKLILEDPSLRDFSASYSRQADILLPKVQSLRDRIAGLKDQTEGGNVFTWIGKSAQGMVLGSFLTRAEDDLEHLYRNTGEQFYQRSGDFSGSPLSADIAELRMEIVKNRDQARALSEELSALKEEHRQISGEFSASGGPGRQIQNLRKQISNKKDELGALYLRFGQAAFADDREAQSSGGSEPGQTPLNFLMNAADRVVLDDARRFERSILDNGEDIKKLQASIDIDEELERIEKYRGSIAEKKAWIRDAQRSIEDFENRIKDAEKHIEELRLI